jgi:hypothetical protein
VTFAILPAMVPGPVPAGASPVPVPAPALPAAPAPAPAPPDPTSPDIWPTFDLTFQPVTPAAVSVASGPVPEAPPAPDSYSPFAAPVDSAGSFTASEAASPPLAPPVADPQAAAAPAPAVARTPPRVALPVVAASKAARSGEQALAGAVFLGLCAWAWKVFNQDAKAGLASAGAGFRSLYDTPSAGPAAARRRFGTGPRVGRPPPLR